MPDESVVNAAADLSINQLRELVNADRAEASGVDPVTPAAEPAKAAPAKTEPATEPELTQDEKDPQRGEDGKFKAAKADEPEVPAGVQKRIDKAVKAQREAERQRDEAVAKNTQVTPPAEVAKTAPPAAPKQEDFATYDEYSRAIARFEARQEIDKELVTQREAGAKRERETAANKQQSDFSAAEVTARETHDDYDDVTAAIEWPKAPGTPAIADYLLSTQNADLMYELGKQPAELKRIAALPPMLAIAALAIFEAKLTPPAPAAEKPPARVLPKPPKNVGGGGTPTVIDLNDPKLDMRAFKREFGKRLAADRD